MESRAKASSDEELASRLEIELDSDFELIDIADTTVETGGKGMVEAWVKCIEGFLSC